MGTDLFLAMPKVAQVETSKMNPRPHQHSSTYSRGRNCVSTANAHQSLPIATIGATRAHAQTELASRRAH